MTREREKREKREREERERERERESEREKEFVVLFEMQRQVARARAGLQARGGQALRASSNAARRSLRSRYDNRPQQVKKFPVQRAAATEAPKVAEGTDAVGVIKTKPEGSKRFRQAQDVLASKVWSMKERKKKVPTGSLPFFVPFLSSSSPSCFLLSLSTIFFFFKSERKMEEEEKRLTKVTLFYSYRVMLTAHPSALLLKRWSF